VRIERISTLTTDAMDLLREYYDAAKVTQRDGPKKIRQVLKYPSSGLWLAYKGEALAGCVMLKAQGEKSPIAVCKRLYVRSSCRRGGIADALVETLETFARNAGMKWVYLDTNDWMTAAVALYRRRGYSACKPFNDNPDANLYFRKKL
jgi:GNAT superfamily N-acetyltransferase